MRFTERSIQRSQQHLQTTLWAWQVWENWTRGFGMAAQIQVRPGQADGEASQSRHPSSPVWHQSGSAMLSLTASSPQGVRQWIQRWLGYQSNMLLSRFEWCILMSTTLVIIILGWQVVTDLAYSFQYNDLLGIRLLHVAVWEIGGHSFIMNIIIDLPFTWEKVHISH